MRENNAISIIRAVVERRTNYGSQEAAAYARGVYDTLQEEHGGHRNPFAGMDESDVEALAERLANL